MMHQRVKAPTSAGPMKAGSRASYYAQRLVIWPGLRRRIGRLLGRPSSPSSRDGTAGGWFEQLRGQGYCNLGPLLAPAQLDDLARHFAGKPSFDCATRRALRPGETATIAEYLLSDVLEAPHLLELANDPALLATVESYFGCRPMISGWALRQSTPSAGEPAELQRFHRDIPDWSVLKLFVYLTDVDAGSGPHTYVEGSHRTRGTFRQAYLADSQVTGRVVSLLGPRGTCILADTYGIHKGLAPTTTPRLMLQVQYTVLPVALQSYRPMMLAREVPQWLPRDVNSLFLLPTG
jgi:hypothetical protein